MIEHHQWSAGDFEVPQTKEYRDFDSTLQTWSLDPKASFRRAHFRRLWDLAVVLLQRGDTARARRAWSIICRSYETERCWNDGLGLEIVEEDEREKKRRKRNHSLGEAGPAMGIRARMRSPVERLQEQTMSRIDNGQAAEALEQLELSLTSQPYQSDPLLNFYAALCIIFLAQSNVPPASDVLTADTVGPTLSLRSPELRKALHRSANAPRLKEAENYLRVALEGLGGVPSTAEHLRKALRKPPKRGLGSVMTEGKRFARMQADLEDVDVALRWTVLDVFALVTDLEAGSDSEDDDDDDDDDDRDDDAPKHPVASQAAPEESSDGDSNSSEQDSRPPNGFSIFGTQTLDSSDEDH